MLPRVGTLSIIILLGLLTVLTAGCEPEQGTGTIHPVEERVPHFHDPDHTIETGSPPAEGLPEQFAKAGATPIHTIGVREGSGPELFGEIRDVIEDPQGRILVLDNEHKEVRIFRADGTHVGCFGRQGEAPGEFQYPAHLDLFEDGTLVVAGRSGRVQFFESSGKTYERTGGFNVEFTPEDACLLEETLYLHGALAKQSEQSIHVYSRDGTRQRSFGPVYQSENEFIRQSISDGKVACDASMGTIVFAFTSAPLLYGYSSEGGLQWTSRIRPFDPMPHEQGVSERGTTSLRHRSEPGTHLMSELTDVPGAGVVAQKMQFPPEDADRAAAPLYTYLISAGDGTGTYVGKTKVGGTAVGPFTHVTSRHLLSARSAPFPKVDVYDVVGVEWTRSPRSAE